MNNTNPDKLQSVAEIMRLISERNKFRESMKAHWIEAGRKPATKHILNVLVRHAQESGEETVLDWLSDASVNEIPDGQVLKYIEAIRPKKDLEDDY
jgi:hypothetical protein